jgi:branched-chain amino acid transport system substrate-binding protein
MYLHIRINKFKEDCLMKRKFRAILIVVIVILALFIAVRFLTKGKNNDLHIGLISPLTGNGANYGKAARYGTDLAIEEINSQGGINGRKLVVIYEDDMGRPKDAISAFKKLVTYDNVPAVLGPFYSSNVLACAPFAEKEKVVLLTPTATSDNIREAGDYVFRVCPSNVAQSQTIAEFAIKKMKLTKGFIIYRNVDYGVTLRDAFLKAFTEMNGEIIGSEAVEPEASDVRSQLTKAKAVNPDFIFAAVHYPEGSAILRQSKELGLSSIVIGTDGGYDPELLSRAGDAAEGSYWVTIGWGDEKSNPSIPIFYKKFREEYGEDPGVYAGLFYDATHVLAKAIESSKEITGQSIQKALSNTVFVGPTGTTKFDAYGDVSKPFSIHQIENGKFKLVPFN